MHARWAKNPEMMHITNSSFGQAGGLLESWNRESRRVGLGEFHPERDSRGAFRKRAI